MASIAHATLNAASRFARTDAIVTCHLTIDGTETGGASVVTIVVSVHLIHAAIKLMCSVSRVTRVAPECDKETSVIMTKEGPEENETTSAG